MTESKREKGGKGKWKRRWVKDIMRKSERMRECKRVRKDELVREKERKILSERKMRA